MMNYSAPLSLDAFAKSCGVTEISKSIFPHDRYQTILDLIHRTRFPEYWEFESCLSAQKNTFDKFIEELRILIEKQLRLGNWQTFYEIEEYFGWIGIGLEHVFEIEGYNCALLDGKILEPELVTSPQAYFNSRSYFRDNCLTMLDYLRHYNMLDVKVLVAAIEKYNDGFLTQWGVNVHDYISLPSLAQDLALRFYAGNAYPIYSFPDSHGFLNQEVRAQLNGGMCMCFSRLQKSGGEMNLAKYPPSVYHTPNGQRIQSIESFDFNSLYPTVFQWDQPTGPGIFYRKSGSNFLPESLLKSGKKASMEAVEWLEYITTTAPRGAIVEHAFNYGERKVNGYHVDGYTEFFGEESHPPLAPYSIAFEYMGKSLNLS